MKKEVKWIQNLEQVVTDQVVLESAYTTVPPCQTESAASLTTIFFPSHLQPFCKSFCPFLRQLTSCDTLWCSHGSRGLSQLWCLSSFYKENLKWDKAPKTSSQSCCSSPTQQRKQQFCPLCSQVMWESHVWRHIFMESTGWLKISFLHSNPIQRVSSSALQIGNALCFFTL